MFVLTKKNIILLQNKEQKLAKGKLLISEPFMKDPNFQRTILLLCHHDKNGSFGLVLNRKLEHKIGDAIEDLRFFDVALNYGGPVQLNTLHFLHTRGDIVANSVKLADGLYWDGKLEQIIEHIKNGEMTEKDIQFYIGYSGWGIGQLEDEYKEKSWLVTDVFPEYVFEQLTDEMWQQVLRDMGGRYKIIANFPTDPSFN